MGRFTSVVVVFLLALVLRTIPAKASDCRSVISNVLSCSNFLKNPTQAVPDGGCCDVARKLNSLGDADSLCKCIHPIASQFLATKAQQLLGVCNLDAESLPLVKCLAPQPFVPLPQKPFGPLPPLPFGPLPPLPFGALPPLPFGPLPPLPFIPPAENQEKSEQNGLLPPLPLVPLPHLPLPPLGPLPHLPPLGPLPRLPPLPHLPPLGPLPHLPPLVPLPHLPPLGPIPRLPPLIPPTGNRN